MVLGGTIYSATAWQKTPTLDTKNDILSEGTVSGNYFINNNIQAATTSAGNVTISFNDKCAIYTLSGTSASSDYTLTINNFPTTGTAGANDLCYTIYLYATSNAHFSSMASVVITGYTVNTRRAVIPLVSGGTAANKLHKVDIIKPGGALTIHAIITEYFLSS